MDGKCLEKDILYITRIMSDLPNYNAKEKREYAQQHGKSGTETTGRHSETITMKKILHYLKKSGT